MEGYLPPGTEAGFFQRSKADFENTGKNRYTLHILPKSCILRPVIVRAQPYQRVIKKVRFWRNLVHTNTRRDCND